MTARFALQVNIAEYEGGGASPSCSLRSDDLPTPLGLSDSDWDGVTHQRLTILSASAEATLPAPPSGSDVTAYILLSDKPVKLRLATGEAQFVSRSLVLQGTRDNPVFADGDFDVRVDGIDAVGNAVLDVWTYTKTAS